MKNRDKSLSADIVRIPYQQMEAEFLLVLKKKGFSDDKAKTCASIFAQNSLDGVYSHGVNRFALFVKFVEKRYIRIDNEPELKGSSAAIEQWDGRLGPGPINALICTERAMELSREYGIGCVGLSNTNHWMRGGTYGWKAAKAGFAFIGWTNTIPNMPAWGAVDCRLGNNPMIFAVPYNNEAIVLDMAMSQFSYGTMESYKLKKQQLPLSGGYDKKGQLTTDPSAIIETQRSLPVGYWKGAGLSLLLNIMAAVLSGGEATHEIGRHEDDFGVSQVYIAIDISKLDNYRMIVGIVNEIIDDYHDSVTESDSMKIVYPGERALNTRKENLSEGIPVERNVWNQIKSL
ncbi:MAG: 3-dehydro-L-gulonate 2-dehydrogenase [Sedimentisphaerales bacterium]|nr:3-dehydro-L-gulonate 2-dehydrogenase [Sedimentisphaerales bacterium]